MIQEYLRNKYREFLTGLDIYENKTSLILSRIILNKESRGQNKGTEIMNDLINYADKNKQVIALTPSSDFGGNKNRLIQFYKRFGFKHNKGQYKHFGFKDDMIRYPKVVNETKSLIKNLLREALDKKIICGECGWDWKESESDKKDLYICHKCGHNNNPKKTLNENLMSKSKDDILQITNFINFTKKYLGIDDDIKVELAYERTPDLKTYAYYQLGTKIKVYVNNRNTGDIMRSIAHELQHHKQYLDGRLNNPSEQGKDGTDIENEANSVAGIILRIYGKKHPEIYL